MLENEYSQTKALFTFVKVYFWFILAIYFIASLSFGVFKDGKGSSLQTFGVLALIGVGLYIYLLVKYGVRRKSLQLYLMNLATGDAVQALESGRRYYSIRRKGLTGADGSGLTIYDEQAIQNDILSFMHGGTRTVDYNLDENAFTTTKMLMAVGCAAVFIGTAYFISPKSQAEPLSSEVTTTNSDYVVESAPQQVQQTEAVSSSFVREEETQPAVTSQENSTATADSLQQAADVEANTHDEVASASSENLDVLGTWVGTLGEKPFVLQIEKAEGGKLTGWNKTGTNKRPVAGILKESAEAGSNVKYELTLNEPGSDKWDGTEVV
jgi:hypothetical protein